MTEATFAVLMALVLGWAVTSHLWDRLNITGALVFTVAGYLLGNRTWGPLAVDVEAPSIHVLAELTLALLLFSDAVRVNASQLRHDLSFPGRLLGIGLPLSVLLGSLVAAVIFDDFSWALAGFVGATLAPTDAALSVQVINDERISLRVRRALNVESGLNDGLATPVVAFTIAVVADQVGTTGHGESSGGALVDLASGIVVGLVFGLGTAALITFGSRRRWVVAGGQRLATLAAALASFALALALDGNGFIAAFVAGIAFGARLSADVADVQEVAELPELLGELLALAVWFLFGAALVPMALDHLSASTLAYALLSLTVLRMLPVAISLLGAGLDGWTVAFVGWFGPRGLASVVFALLAIEELGGGSQLAATAVAGVALTVLLSVVLHGVSAGPLGRRYVLAEAEPKPADVPRSRRPGHRSVPRDR